MTPQDLKKLRQNLGFTQTDLAARLRTTRQTITRYECGTHHIPGSVELAVQQLSSVLRIPLAGIVAAGDPIEPIPQTEVVDVPPQMMGRGETFALRIKGNSMRDEGILPGDLVIVERKATARNGQTVVALVNNEATIKTFHRKDGRIELRPANEALKPIPISAEDDFQVLGVVIGVMRYCR